MKNTSHYLQHLVDDFYVSFSKAIDLYDKETRIFYRTKLNGIQNITEEDALIIQIILAVIDYYEGNVKSILSIDIIEVEQKLNIDWWAIVKLYTGYNQDNFSEIIVIINDILTKKDSISINKIIVEAFLAALEISIYGGDKENSISYLHRLEDFINLKAKNFKTELYYAKAFYYYYVEFDLEKLNLFIDKYCTELYSNPERRIVLQSIKAKNYFGECKYSEAIQILLRCVEDSKKTGSNIKGLVDSFNIQLINCYIKQDIKEALEYVKKLEKNEDIPNVNESIEGQFFHCKAEIYFKVGDYNEALISVNTAISLLHETPLASIHSYILKVKCLAMLNEGISVTEEIDDLIKVYDKYNDTLEKNKIIELNTKYDTAQKEQEIKHLKEIDAFKTRFFSNITHDIRTPMSLVLAPLETLLKNTTEPKLVKSVKTAYSNAQKLENLLDQLLDLNKIEEGILKPKYVYGDITAFCSNMIQQIETKNQIQYSNSIPSTKSTCYFAEDAWYKILQNLLSNAIKFSGKRDKIIVTLSLENNHLKLAVQDQGIGISEADLPKIFDRFYQVDSADTKPYQGSGIGLSIVKEYVELLGGKVEVESSVRKGTCFTVSIPYKEVLKSEDISTTPIYNFTVKKSIDITENTVEETSVITQKDSDIVDTILLVEDNEELRFFLREQLATQYHIIEAADGREGVQKASKYLPSIIISDIMMPELDGITLCKIVKETPQTNHIPVILLTAKTSIESELEGYNVKADGYIKKPFSIDILKSNIQSVIDNRAMMRKSIMNSIQKNIAVNLELEDENDFMEKFRRTIHQHIFNKQLNVNFIAELLNISRATLLRKVQHYTGKSPKDIITSMRLNTAHILIKQGNYSIKSISYKLGYSNIEGFYKAFKKEYDFTPGSIKKGKGFGEGINSEQ